MIDYLKQFKSRHDRKVKQFKGDQKKMAIALMRVYDELKKCVGPDSEGLDSEATLTRLVKDLGTVTDAIKDSDVLE